MSEGGREISSEAETTNNNEFYYYEASIHETRARAWTNKRIDGPLQEDAEV